MKKIAIWVFVFVTLFLKLIKIKIYLTSKKSKRATYDWQNCKLVNWEIIKLVVRRGFSKRISASVLFSLFKVQYQDGAEMDMAETVTFFNDMCCMGPATLIDKRINWLEIDNNEVKASFTNNNITIYAWLYFNDIGELENFNSNDRYDYNAGKKVPWSTPLKDYEEVNGYKLAR